MYSQRNVLLYENNLLHKITSIANKIVCRFHKYVRNYFNQICTGKINSFGLPD